MNILKKIIIKKKYDKKKKIHKNHKASLLAPSPSPTSNNNSKEEEERLERRRSRVRKEGPARTGTTERAVDRRITEINGALELVEAILKHSETKEETDEDHHQYHARAQHAHPPSATHYSFCSLTFSL